MTYLHLKAFNSLIGNMRQQYGHSNSLLPAAGFGGRGISMGVLIEGGAVNAVERSDLTSSRAA
jgi:hypothetical protein